jgi:hypothetical protein
MNTVDSSQGFEINKKLSFHIAAEFVLQLSKSSSEQYRNCTTGKSGRGGII